MSNDETSPSSWPVNVWFEEIFKDNMGLKFKIKDYLFSGQSEFQKVDIVETVSHGKLLAHDGMVMVTERDEFIYHDMITHVPLFVHPNPKRVLVIGGGDGGTVREVLRHKSVEQVVMVEIDGMVVDACRQFIPQTSAALSDPRVKLIIDDGVEYAKSYGAQTASHASTKSLSENGDPDNGDLKKFDVVIVDSSDPIGPATPLFNEDFYKDILNLTTENGIVVSQAESPYYDAPMQNKLVEILSEVFPKVHLYNYSNLSYPGGFWSFSFASRGLCPRANFSKERVFNSGLKFSLYNPELHLGAFALPQFMWDKMESFLSPLPPLKI